jgi:4-hydroxythreonine-4-phosphate dehydrogenase
MRPLIAITMGDPAGVGPEIIAKALSDPAVYESCRPVVVGDGSAMRMGIEVAKARLKVHSIKELGEAEYRQGAIDLLDLANIDPARLVMGVPQAMAGRASVEYVLRATDMALAGEVDAIVTAPLNKEAMHMGGYNYPGHTELLAEKAGTKNYAMMLIAGNLRVVHVTTHIPLRLVPERITKDRIVATIEVAYDAARKLGIEAPRIAVAGLNPHSSDGGLFGDEEKTRIEPAIAEVKRRGLNVEGPIPPDTVFGKALGGLYDVVVAMYHDQGHIPVKMAGFRWDEAAGEWGDMAGVNMTIGLPFIRTSVDHGTAYGRAGRRDGTANPQSLKEAIQVAARMAEARERFKRSRKDRESRGP